MNGYEWFRLVPTVEDGTNVIEAKDEFVKSINLSDELTVEQLERLIFKESAKNDSEVDT